MPKLHKHRWGFILTGAAASGGSRGLGLPRFLAVFLILVVTVGLVGFGRMVYLGAGYALAMYSVSELQRTNRKLGEQMENLERFVSLKTENIAMLAAYEDRARLRYGMEAISGDVRKAGVGGLPSRDDVFYASMLDPQIVKAESLRMQVSALNYQAELQESTLKQVFNEAQRVQNDLSKRPSIWPATGRLTSTFGFRYHPFNGLRLMHEGLDIANSTWTPIYATANGQVSEVSSGTDFGNLVKIKHDSVYTTLYAHLQKAAVTVGQPVKRGDVVGYMGNTGRSTGSHLHYEVHRNGRAINPMAFIVPEDQIVD